MADIGNAVKNASNAAQNAASNASKVADKAQSTAKSVASTAKQEVSQVTSSVENAGSNMSKMDQFKEKLEPLHNEGPKDDYMVGEEAPEDKEVGEKVSPGRVVGEDGTIKKSNTAEGIEAAKNVLSTIATVYSGGAAAGVKTAGEATVKEVAKETGKEIAKETGKEIADQTKKKVAAEAVKGAGAGNKEALKNAASSATSEGKENAIGKVASNVINSNEISKDAVKKASEILDKGERYLAEGIDKIPLAEQVSDFHKELFTSINGVYNAVGDIFAGNFSGAVQNLKKAVGDGAKFTFKSIVLLILLTLFGIGLSALLLFLPFFLILMPIINSAKIVDDTVSNIETAYSDNASASIYGAGLYMTEAVKAVVSEVPGFEDLSNGRKVVVVAGATAIGTPYKSGGKPTEPTAEGITDGLDANGFVEWVFWNVTGNDPGSTSPASSGSYVSISQSDLKPGDIGVNGDEVGIYMGDNIWVHVDKNAGIIRSQYSGFTSFYSYKDIDTVAVAAGDSGGSAQGYYTGPGPSGSLRDRVIGWAEILHGLNIPYNNSPGYNTANKLDVNANNFWTITPAGLPRGGGKTVPPYDPTPGAHNDHNLKGLDCGGYAGYAYFLATNGKSESHFDGFFGGVTPKYLKEISRDQAQKGDVVYAVGSHVMLLDHFEGDKLYVYEMSGCASHEYTINGVKTIYKGSTSVGTGCNGAGICKKYQCKYYTYVGPEE